MGLSPPSVIFLTIFLDITGFGLVIPLLPFYAATFQAGSTALGVLLTSFSIMQFIFAPIIGQLSDKVGRKPVLMLSILISAISFIIFAVSTSYLMLLLSRIVAGMATETAVAQAYMADITSEEERTTGMGQIGAAFGAGFIIGPAIGGFLSVYGFKAPGYMAAILTFINLLFVFLFLPESIRPLQKRQSVKDTKKGFFRLMKQFKKPVIGSVLSIVFIITLAFSTIPVIAPLLGIAFFNLSSVEMSYVFIYIGIVQVLLQGLIIGQLSTKMSEEALIAFGALFMMIGMFIMPLIPHIVNFLTTITMIAIGNGIISTSVPSFISKRTPDDEQGSMLGFTQSVTSIARVPGPVFGGLIFEYIGLVTPFFFSAILLLISFILSCKVLQACKVNVSLRI